MAHARLRGEMDDVRKAMLRKQLRHPIAVGEIAFDELKSRQPAKFGKARLFQLGIVIIVEIVEADDGAPALQQPARDMKADEAGGAGDKDRSVSHRFSHVSARARAILEPPQVHSSWLLRTVEF